MVKKKREDRSLDDRERTPSLQSPGQSADKTRPLQGQVETAQVKCLVLQGLLYVYAQSRWSGRNYLWALYVRVRVPGIDLDCVCMRDGDSDTFRDD